MKETVRKLKMIFKLARRGAWYGVWMFSKTLIYALSHRRCRQCGAVKGFNSNSRCFDCQYSNLMRALETEVVVDDEY